MKNILFSTKPWRTQFLLIIRLFVGCMLIRHGWQIFDPQHINDSETWLTEVNFPFPRISAYIGKLSELLGGIFLALGFCIRIIALPAVFTMFIITFIIGNGDIFGERSYPFLLLLYYITFFITGPGKWSLDYLLFDKKNEKQIPVNIQSK